MDRTVGRIAAALVIAAISLSACSTAEQSTPTPPQPTDDLTLPEPTQTPLYPDGVFPIATGYGLLLGGSTHGEWLDAEAVHGMFMGEKIGFRAYDGINPPVEGTGTSQRTDPNAFKTCPVYGMSISDDPLKDELAVAGGWDAMPRVAEKLDAKSPEYATIIQELLFENGINEPDVRVTGVWNVDLQDDGTMEVIISASKLSDAQRTRKGDYSIVAIQKVIDNRFEIIPVILDIYPVPDEHAWPWTPSIWLMLDLNGDGDLEIVTRREGYRGMLTEVYEIDGEEARQVFSIGCPSDPAALADTTLLPSTATYWPDATGVFPILSGAGLLGASRDGEWLDAAETASLVQGEVRYRLFTEGKPAGDIDRVLQHSDGVCHGLDYVVEPYPRVDGYTAGVAGDWDVVPRTAEALDLTIPEHTSAVRDLLVGDGLTDPDVALTAVSRVDLDGDGADEVLITANRMHGLQPDGIIRPGIAAGDYTLIALRTVVKDEARTIPIYMKTFPREDIMDRPWIAGIAALLDLNGDGDLEIIVHYRAFESSQTEVYELDGGEVRLVLTMACVI